jgi:hypothetical protein
MVCWSVLRQAALLGILARPYLLSGLILECARVLVAQFFRWGHTETFCTVPIWHTKNSDYFCHSKFHSLKTNSFGQLLTVKDHQKICACLKQVGMLHIC